MEIKNDTIMGILVVGVIGLVLVGVMLGGHAYDIGTQQGTTQTHNDICNHFGYEVQSPYTTDRIWCYDAENDVFVKIKFTKVKVN